MTIPDKWLEKEVRCPRCGAPAVLVYDWDKGQPWVQPWLVEAWRFCSCPMPARVTEYDEHEGDR